MQVALRCSTPIYTKNILVFEEYPTVVSAMITSIEPAFWYANAMPDFAQLVSHPPSGYKLEPKSEV